MTAALTLDDSNQDIAALLLDLAEVDRPSPRYATSCGWPITPSRALGSRAFPPIASSIAGEFTKFSSGPPRPGTVRRSTALLGIFAILSGNSMKIGYLGRPLAADVALCCPTTMRSYLGQTRGESER